VAVRSVRKGWVCQRVGYALTPFLRRATASPSTPAIASRLVPGSGVTTIPVGSIPVISEGFSVAPEAVYSPISPVEMKALKLVTSLAFVEGDSQRPALDPGESFSRSQRRWSRWDRWHCKRRRSHQIRKRQTDAQVNSQLTSEGRRGVCRAF